jgi:hypothetical protein
MFADHAQWRAVRQAFHDGMHYQPKVFEIASKVKVPARTAPRTALQKNLHSRATTPPSWEQAQHESVTRALAPS